MLQQLARFKAEQPQTQWCRLSQKARFVLGLLDELLELIRATSGVCIQDLQQTAGRVLGQQTLSEPTQTSEESSFEAEQRHQLRCALTALVYYVVPCTLTTDILEAARAYMVQLYELPDSMLLDPNVQGLACALCRIALFLDAWQVVCTYNHSASVNVIHA